MFFARFASRQVERETTDGAIAWRPTAQGGQRFLVVLVRWTDGGEQTMRAYPWAPYLEFECGFNIFGQQVANVLVVDVEIRRANERFRADGHRRRIEGELLRWFMVLIDIRQHGLIAWRIHRHDGLHWQ